MIRIAALALMGIIGATSVSLADNTSTLRNACSLRCMDHYGEDARTWCERKCEEEYPRD